MKADILRKKFLSYFKSKGHKIVESDSLVPKDDPTVLFTPAGMNQFKKEFLGADSGFKRAASAQRCLRTDDLEKVGKTSGHHTFFEMLGNFSFGDYFKEEAIVYGWEFLTQELKIKPDKLWVSIYKDDDEAYKVWQDLIKLPREKLMKLGDKENFWPSEAKLKGPNGPCGPCSEIFFDQGKNLKCGNPDCNPACDCGRFVEVWNLVFTQFNRKNDGILEPLPRKNIDTGMGLERLAAVMQGVKNNFETDLFSPLVKEIDSEAQPDKVSSNMGLVYAISDHIRAIAFAVNDGVIPSNEARGYVIRKLIRKSVLHLQWSLGVKKPFLYKLVPVLSEIMKIAYPQLERRKENISQIILAEEENFISILESSKSLFKDKFKVLSNKQDGDEAAVIAFKLYDTYGIPFELTKDWLDRSGISISLERFEQELEVQKERSKLKSAMKGEVFAVKDMDYGIKETKFLGYRAYEARAKLIKFLKENNEVKKIKKGDNATVILDKTVFYPESGGQVGDTGELVKGKNVFEVLDTKKAGKIILHIGQVKSGGFKKGDLLLSRINSQRRLSIARNHTATHLLQAALIKVLGVHIKQQGSLVAEDRLRFDFTHFKAINKEELDRIEELVNSFVLNNYGLEVKELSLEKAKKSGALAFFGEKYESKVRVISIGALSKELCGGTHLEHTGSIGFFRIIQQGAVASGIRRIEAVTGAFAYKRIKEEEERLALELERMSHLLKEKDKQLNALKFGNLQDSIKNILDEPENTSVINNIKIITALGNNIDISALRSAMDMVKQKTDNSIIALGSQDMSNSRAFLIIGVTADLLSKGIDASELIRDIAAILGGSGGGRKDFAQAGGNRPQNFPQAFERLKERVKDLK